MDTTTTQITPGVANYYDRKLLRKATPLLVYTNYAQVRDIPQGNSTVIKFRRYSLLSAATTPLTEGVTPAGSQMSKTDITATVEQYGDFLTITDKVTMTVEDNALNEAANELGQQAGNTFDQLTRDILAATTTIQYASTATSKVTITSAMKISKDEIKEMVRTLKGNNVQKITEMVDASDGVGTSPIDSCFIGFVHPNTTYDLKDVTGFIRVEEYGQRKALPGEIGALDEVRFLETTNAKVYTGAGASSIDVYGTIIIGRDAYGMSRISGEALQNIVKPLGSAGSADPLNQRQTSGWKATFVAKILNQSFMGIVLHAVS